MRGTLFRLFDVGAPSYFVLLLTGFILATIVGCVWARRIGEDPDVMVDLALAMLLSGVVGARLLHVLADGYFWDYVHLCTAPSQVDWRVTAAECASPRYNGVWDAAKNVCHPKEADCLAWAAFWAGGLAYYGGLAGALPAGYWLLKRDKFPFWKAADLVGMVMALGLAFGRMGCLLAGCCFGVESRSTWGLVFPPFSPASEWQWRHGMLATKAAPSLAVVPTQMLESAASLGIFAFCLMWLHPRKRYDGQVFFAMLALYSIARFVLEFFRSDDRGGVGPFSTSQWIGIGLVAAAALAHRARARGGLAIVTTA